MSTNVPYVMKTDQHLTVIVMTDGLKFQEFVILVTITVKPVQDLNPVVYLVLETESMPHHVIVPMDIMTMEPKKLNV